MKKIQVLGYSRKFGYEKSRGEYIIFFDDDDYYTNEDFFKKAINIFNEYKSQDKKLAFVCGNVVAKEIDGTITKTKYKLDFIGEVDNAEFLRNMQLKYRKPLSTFPTIFSRESLENSEFSRVDMVDDTCIYKRSLLFANIYFLEDVIGVYRKHIGGITKSLSVDFRIALLEESRKVMEEIRKRKLFEDEEVWLYDHIIMTAKYYLIHCNITKEGFYELLKYCVSVFSDEELKVKIENEIIEIYNSKYGVENL